MAAASRRDAAFGTSVTATATATRSWDALACGRSQSPRSLDTAAFVTLACHFLLFHFAASVVFDALTADFVFLGAFSTYSRNTSLLPCFVASTLTSCWFGGE